ncbi:hypothetical protein CF98_05595 [Halopseudomonas bauzanensis]|nr:hypothetical protein CF98_05595 [Halopseudomonas bauzanensis]
MMSVPMDLAAQLAAVGCPILVALFVDLPVTGWPGVVPWPIAGARMLLAVAVMVTAQHLVAVMVPLLLMVFERLAVFLGFTGGIRSFSGLGHGAQQGRYGEQADKKVA